MRIEHIGVISADDFRLDFHYLAVNLDVLYCNRLTP